MSAKFPASVTVSDPPSSERPLRRHRHQGRPAERQPAEREPRTHEPAPGDAAAVALLIRLFHDYQLLLCIRLRAFTLVKRF